MPPPTPPARSRSPIASGALVPPSAKRTGSIPGRYADPSYTSRPGRPPRRDRPDVGHDAVLDHVEEVVEIDGGGAVAAHHLGHVAQVERRRAGEVNEAVLLSVVSHPALGVRDQRRRD